MEAAMEGMMSDLATIWFISLLALIFNIWLIVVAFKESTGWGIACILGLFFFPISIIFAIMHWRIAWKPFVALLVCVAITTGLFFKMVSNTASMAENVIGEDGQLKGEVQDYGKHLENLVASGEINDAQRQEEIMKYTMSKMFGQAYEKKYPMAAGDGVDLNAIRGESPLDKVDVDAKIDDAIRNEEQLSAQEQQPTRYRAYLEFPFKQADQYLNRRVRITTVNGVVRVGDLIDATPEIIRIEQRAHGGNLRYEVVAEEVAKLEYWGWEEY